MPSWCCYPQASSNSFSEAFGMIFPCCTFFWFYFVELRMKETALEWNEMYVAGVSEKLGRVFSKHDKCETLRNSNYVLLECNVFLKANENANRKYICMFISVVWTGIEKKAGFLLFISFYLSKVGIKVGVEKRVNFRSVRGTRHEKVTT